MRPKRTPEEIATLERQRELGQGPYCAYCGNATKEWLAYADFDIHIHVQRHLAEFRRKAKHAA